MDGDTLWNNGVKIRIADIDTPEISQPHCAAEKAPGERATVRLMQLVGPFETLAWKNRDKDRNGRKLRVLVRNGQSLGDILVSEGLARTWTGQRHPWC
ncbi:thermonuclease family protein [Rhizobium sp. NLR4a]|uniref:thermonuclease family protein n=1 Tax=Rhizobium sp. NLR4a TaxID=2731117 RepID=UPI00287FC166|nr:thermonuclease family protein [Rhizobium sp. NLR4a]